MINQRKSLPEHPFDSDIKIDTSFDKSRQKKLNSRKNSNSFARESVVYCESLGHAFKLPRKIISKKLEKNYMSVQEVEQAKHMKYLQLKSGSAVKGDFVDLKTGELRKNNPRSKSVMKFDSPEPTKDGSLERLSVRHQWKL